MVWLSVKTTVRLFLWPTECSIFEGPVLRRINLLPCKGTEDGETVSCHHVGSDGLTRQCAVSILQRSAAVATLSSHSFCAGLTQEPFDCPRLRARARRWQRMLD